MRIASKFQISSGGGIPVLEAPTGSINGTNTSFSLSDTPITDTLMLFLDGLYLKPITDYTISGSTITMTTAPTTAQIIRAAYRK